MKFIRHHRGQKQAGYMLLAILVFLMFLMVAMLGNAHSIAQQIQRDREEELVRRGTQYARAIKKYYRKFGRYPNSIEELVNTNNVRFLRKKYKDPITGKDEWKLIRFGQARSMQGGVPGMGGGGLPGASPAAGGAQPPTQPPRVGTPVSETSSQIGSGPTFGGGPIVGVSSTSEKTGIKEINGKTKYNEWEFVYDPRMDAPQGGMPGGQPGQGGQGGFGNPMGGSGQGGQNNNRGGGPGGQGGDRPR